MKKDSELLLLDVNVLLALAWPNHQFHAESIRRLESASGLWATCALTQLSFIRLSSNASAVPIAKTPLEAASLLASMLNDSAHVYLDSLPSPAGEPCSSLFEKILGSKQVTDAYLLALARHSGAKLLTFDVKLRAMDADEESVEVLGAPAR